MSVNIRKRKNKDGTTSLILDIYHNGKREFEFLKELKLLKASTAIDREENRQRLALAAQIKNKREQELQSEDYAITPAFKNKVDFIQYFDNYVTNYTKKDKRVMEASLSKFKSFMVEEKITALNTKQVTENIVFNFKEYLEQTLNGESPATYFKRFKKALRQGIRDKVFSINPALDVTIKENEGIKKEILTFDEIQLLASTASTNQQVKKAFLFSCLTGLRYCDIIALKWENINGNVLKVIQQKTGNPVSINLNDNAMQILGAIGIGKQNVFTLPSHTACLKDLKVWCKKAGITKKISWHCARHSFATNIIYYGSDVNSVSSLLGHSSLNYTQKYVRVVESLKEKAVQNLPSIKL